MPATRPKFWREKFARNVDRDKRALRMVKKAGWQPLVVWECQTRPKRAGWLQEKLRSVLLG